MKLRERDLLAPLETLDLVGARAARTCADRAIDDPYRQIAEAEFNGPVTHS